VTTTASQNWQLNMFGAPEIVTGRNADGYRDDAPVPAERELLWPLEHTQILGVELLERLYGDVPRRTRLTILEVCRRLRCGHSHVYNLVDAGSLDAFDSRHPQATQAYITVYRYSLVRFLFNREFVEGCTRGGMPKADLQRCMLLADQLREAKRN
jgi:hypothetical protein